MLNALQINQKGYTLSTFPSRNRQNFEDSGKVLANSVCKGPVKLIKQVKIAHSFLQFVSDQFRIIILSLPM